VIELSTKEGGPHKKSLQGGKELIRKGSRDVFIRPQKGKLCRRKIRDLSQREGGKERSYKGRVRSISNERKRRLHYQREKP